VGQTGRTINKPALRIDDALNSHQPANAVWKRHVTPGADMLQRIDQRREEFDGDNFFVQPQRLKERLDIQPFPRRVVLEYAEIPVERIHVNGASLFGWRRRVGFRHWAIEWQQKSLIKGLIFGAERLTFIATSRNLRLGDPKGLPSFFAYSGRGNRAATSH
jgi:hypothetical protein